MSKAYDHYGKPAGHGKVQVYGKNVVNVMLPRGHRFAEECPNELDAAYLKFSGSYKAK
jgi:hypothetical protein